MASLERDVQAREELRSGDGGAQGARGDGRQARGRRGRARPGAAHPRPSCRRAAALGAAEGVSPAWRPPLDPAARRLAHPPRRATPTRSPRRLPRTPPRGRKLPRRSTTPWWMPSFTSSAPLGELERSRLANVGPTAGEEALAQSQER